LKVYAFLQRKDAPADPSTAKAGTHCTVDFPDAKHYQTAEDFFGDPKIDLVAVCSGHDTHALFAEMAMNAGKDVIVEKPFTRTTEEADHVIEVSKKTGRLLTVFQNRRWDSDFRTIRHVVTSGALGKITEFENHYDLEFPSWIQGWTKKEYIPGSGMLFGLGTHTIDQCLVLFGRPASVTAFLRSLRGVESEVDDSFTIILQYDGEQKDLLVTIKTTVVSPMKDQLKAFVRGTGGSFIKYGTCPQENQTIAGGYGVASEEGFGVEDPSIYGLLTTVKEFDSSYQTYDKASKKYIGKVPSLVGAYTGYYENVVDAIRGRAALEVKPETSRDGLRVIELARESNEKGITVKWSD